MSPAVDPRDTDAVRRAIAARLVAAGWRFRRGNTAPWIPPGEKPPRTQLPVRPGRVATPGDEPAGYSLLGAAERQAEMEWRAAGVDEQAFRRHVA